MAALHIPTNTPHRHYLAAPQSVRVFISFGNFVVYISWNKAPLRGRPSTVVGHTKKKKMKKKLDGNTID